jgi:ribosomal protein S18 acetylase RimI-like enzyme
MFVAETEGSVAAIQCLDLWARYIHSMRHAGQIGTFVLPALRGQGVGKLLWNQTNAFAASAGYEKIVAQVRASNTLAQSFYRGLGFQECGRFSRHVFIDGGYDDEVLLELFL